MPLFVKTVWCYASASAASCLFSSSPSFCGGLALAVSFSWLCTRWTSNYFAMSVMTGLISLIWKVSVLRLSIYQLHDIWFSSTYWLDTFCLVLLDDVETELLELVETVVDLTKMELVLDRINEQGVMLDSAYQPDLKCKCLAFSIYLILSHASFHLAQLVWVW